MNETNNLVTVPKGWFEAGSHPHNYKMGLDTNVKHNGAASAYIKFIGDTAEGFGTLMQMFNADAYHGQRVRMSAWMKTKDVEGTAQLWLRLDGESSMLGFDNMDNRPVRGTTEWTQYDLVLDVPDATDEIAFGYFVSGKGQAWTDDFTFELVGSDVETTNRMKPEEKTEQYPKQPSNLNFEEGTEICPEIVTVDPQIYDAYTGTYQSRTEVTITRRDDKLFIATHYGDKAELFPISKTEFFDKGRPQGTIRFVRDEDGQVTHYIRTWYGGERIVKRKE